MRCSSRSRATRLARARGGWILVSAKLWAGDGHGRPPDAYFAMPARAVRRSTRMQNRQRDHARGRPAARGRMHVPRGPLSPRRAGRFRPLLPLHLVPAGERRSVRAQRHDRVRARAAAERRARAGRHAVGERRRAAHRRCPQCRIAVWSHYAGAGDAVRFVRVGSSTSRRGCRPTSTSSPRRSSRGSCCRRTRVAVPEYYDAKSVLAGREPRPPRRFARARRRARRHRRERSRSATRPC